MEFVGFMVLFFFVVRNIVDIWTIFLTRFSKGVWFPLASEPRYELIGDPQAVYLMVRCRIFFKLQKIISRIIQQIDCIFLPFTDIRSRYHDTENLSPTQAIPNALFATRLQNSTNTVTRSSVEIPPPPEHSTDEDRSDIVSHSSYSHTSEQEQQATHPLCVSTAVQTEDSCNQVSCITDPQWAWLND
jgi:hypothetical protein